MTVTASSSTTTEVVPIGLTITREAVPAVAQRLAHDLFPSVKGDPYRYLPDKSGEKDLATSIGNYLHVILNQMNVDKRECKHCSGTQQDHDWIGGWCSPSNGKKFEARERRGR